MYVPLHKTAFTVRGHDEKRSKTVVTGDPNAVIGGEVAEAVCDQPILVDLDAPRNMWAMTDDQIRQIYQRIEQQPAGGVDGVALLLIVLIVLEVTGYIDIIPNR